MSEISQILDDVKQIPVSSQTIARLLNIINNPTKGIKDLERIIKLDPGLTSRLLQTVNSAYYGVKTKVSDITTAMALLGFNTIKTLAFSIAILDALSTDIEGIFSYDDLWKHLIYTANLSHLIAIEKRNADPELCYICGLLHDIGKLIFAKFMPKDYRLAIALMRTEEVTEMEAEERIFKTNHQEIGYELLLRWNIPEEITIPIKYHHTPQKATSYENVACIVGIANYSVSKEICASVREVKVLSLDENIWSKVGIDADTIHRLANQVGNVVHFFDD